MSATYIQSHLNKKTRECYLLYQPPVLHQLQWLAQATAHSVFINKRMAIESKASYKKCQHICLVIWPIYPQCFLLFVCPFYCTCINLTMVATLMNTIMCILCDFLWMSVACYSTYVLYAVEQISTYVCELSDCQMFSQLATT